MKHNFSLLYKKNEGQMGKKVITFDEIEIEKYKFHRYKSSIFLEDVEIDNVLVSNKIFSGEKKL